MTDDMDKLSLYQITYYNSKEFCTYILKVFGESPDNVACMSMFSRPEIQIHRIQLLRGPVIPS